MEERPLLRSYIVGGCSDAGMARGRDALLGVALLALSSAGCSRTSLLVDDGAGARGADEPADPECPGADDLSPVLVGRIRDFQAAHPDFEDFIGSDPGIVLSQLGDDGLPVYAGIDGNPSTSGKDTFDQWYRDVPGVNLGANLALELSLSSNGWMADRPEFFPIDGQLFGNEDHAHNFHFTVELHTTFRHRGGEVFRFEGDDDLWAFVGGRLALDLGGVHGAEEGTVHIDSLDLEIGEVHTLDLFYAERHTSASVLHVRLDWFELCGQ